MTKILMVGAECAPFSKTGGLADVMGTLPQQLAALGYDARVMVPLHKITKQKYIDELTHVCNFYVTIGWKTEYAGIEMLQKDGVTYYFVDNEHYFSDDIYMGGEREAEQYAFFSRVVLEALTFMDYMPDILHVNDWHTAIIPMLVKVQYQGRPQGGIKTLFTIHNLMYQGKYSFEYIRYLYGIEEKYYSFEYLEAYGCANILKSALVFADKLSTVSPTYSQEIKYAYYGEGMEGILNARSADLYGIINGINTQEFDPAADEYIAENYTLDTVQNKYKNKEALIREMELDVGTNTPILGMVTRLTPQKGLDLVKRIMDEMMMEDMAFVLLGSGDTSYENYFVNAAWRFSGKVGVRIGYDNALAHKIYAGADFFLMPSKFEPCGISQMISMRYGTLPIVRETGGLKDTVKPYNKYTGEGTGFTFSNYNAHEMLDAIRFAVSTMKDKVALLGLMEQAMQEDNSFESSAKKYAQLFDIMMGK